jgi:hypothetical protein
LSYLVECSTATIYLTENTFLHEKERRIIF